MVLHIAREAMPEVRGKEIFQIEILNTWGILEGNRDLGWYIRYNRARLLLPELRQAQPLVWKPCSVKLDYYLVSKSYDLDNLVRESLNLLVDTMVLVDDYWIYNVDSSVYLVEGILDERLRIVIYEWIL